MSKAIANNGTAFLENEMCILNSDFSRIAALATIAFQRADIEHDEQLYYLIGTIVDSLFDAKSRMFKRMSKFIDREDGYNE